MTLEKMQQFYRSRRAALGEPKVFEWPDMPADDGEHRGMDCTRVLTVLEGQLEADFCTGKGYTVNYVKVDDRATLEATRDYYRGQRSAVEQPWHYDKSANVGTQIYYEERGDSRLYWDHAEELWFGLIRAPDNRRDAIFDLWAL